MQALKTLDILPVSESYKAGLLSPADVVAEVYDRIAAHGDDHVWIHLVSREAALERANRLSCTDAPLFGIPFAVKDNIDVAGLPTTAGCPAFRYTAKRSATVVARLLDAGAILIGKTNMDQFATGLTGTRSPYGVPINPFDNRYIPGGSSSGSAVAVSSGVVSFSLGTDTAGSGRVPAAFNNIVGHKPTRGFFSTTGVFPACRTLDCVSVFAATCEDAAVVAEVLAGYDPEDPYSRRDTSAQRFEMRSHSSFRFGVPDPAALEFFGDCESPKLFEQAIARLKQAGGQAVTIDFAPLRESACLLYDGPWVAERFAALKSFIGEHGEEMHPVTRAIIESGANYSAVDVFEAEYRLAALKRRIEPMWSAVEVLLLPTAGRIYTVEEVLADPVKKNSDLGYYTNFVNLLDLCATAVPTSFAQSGLPFGVTVMAPAGEDGFTLDLARRLHACFTPFPDAAAKFA